MFKRQKGSITTEFVIMIILFITTLCAYSFLHRGDYKPAVNSYIPPDGQGLYETCPPSDGSRCFDRLKQISAAGFKLVLNYRQLYGTAEQQLTYAEQAHSLGIKVIWAINDPVFWNGTDLRSHYSDLATTCSCSDNNGFIRYIVRLVKDLPATWGYYIGDEVSPSDHTKLKMVTDLVKQIDPHHPRLFISCAECDPKSHPKYVASLIPMADTTDVVGVDWYPVGHGTFVSDTGKVAGAVQSVAGQYGKQSAMVLQSFSWTQYNATTSCSPYPGCATFPSSNEMRQMLNLTLQNAHPRLILWYSYYNILKSDNPSGHWADLVAAIHGNFSTPTHT